MERTFDVGGIYKSIDPKKPTDETGVYLLTFGSETREYKDEPNTVFCDTCMIVSPESMKQYTTTKEKGFFHFNLNGKEMIVHARGGQLCHAENCIGEKVSQIDIDGELFKEVEECLASRTNEWLRKTV